jgi:ADP-ribosylglycohydrolase
MRVAPFGIVAAGRPLLASGLAAMDGSVTHSGEGILAGQAVAVAIASAMTGNSLEDVFSSVRREIPSDSWTMRGIERAIAIGEQSSDVWSALDVLHRDIACTAYHWSDLGPEAVALAFGLLAASRGDFRDAVLGGVNIGRDTDTIAAIAGAILGARQGIDALPREWVSRVGTVRGVCLRVVQGADILQTADQLAALSRTWGSAP